MRRSYWPLRTSTFGGLLSVTVVYRASSVGVVSTLAALPEPSPGGPSALPDDMVDLAIEVIAEELAPATRLAYSAGWAAGRRGAPPTSVRRCRQLRRTWWVG